MNNSLSHREVFDEARKYFNKGLNKNKINFLFSKNKKKTNQMGGRKVAWGELKIRGNVQLSNLPQSQKKFISKLDSLSHKDLNILNQQLHLNKVENIEDMKINIINKRINDIIKGANVWSI